MTLLIKLLFIFVLVWVLGRAVGLSYNQKMYWATIVTMEIGYLENAHGLAWKYLKETYCKLFKKEG